MKIFVKRSFAMVLTLVMCIGLFSGITFAETATKATTSYSTSSNSGIRGEVCTALPSSALDYYTGSYAFSTLSTQSSSTILSSLRTLTTNAHKKSTSYENCKDYADQTDCQSNNGKVTLLYTGYQANASQFSGNSPGWNREHVWPQNLGGFGTSGPGSDLHHIRPDDVKTNGDRSSKRYGNVNGGTASTALITGAVGTVGGYYDSSYFEPLDEVKGDVARICLYMHVRYGGNSSYNCGDITKVFESVSTLLEWMELDPVDTWEMGRNEVVENIQGNRNPLIDYPEYAWLIFGKDVPTGYTSPSGGAGSSYTITATSNNTSYGTVSLSGHTITAYPKTGYYVAGYTVVSGSATVTQEGNVFTVNATSDCTVRINFAAKTTVSLSFYENGSKASTLTGYAGEDVTLPACSSTVPTGYSFVGWVSSAVAETTVKPTVYAAGSSYTPTAATTFHALYSRVEGGSGNAGEYSLFTGTLTEGDYIIVYDDMAMVAADSDGNTRLDATGVTITNDCISQPNSSIVWHIAPTADGYCTLYNAAAASYAGGNGTKNQSTLLSSLTDYAKWTAAEGNGSGTFEFINLGNHNKGVNANLRRNGTVGFACYAIGTGNSLSLYKGESGIVYYTTTAPVCSHNWVAGSIVRPTCTEGGYTPYTCSKCGASKQENATNPTGHRYSTWIPDNKGSHYKTCSSCGDKITETCTYEAVVTAPTETEAGYTTHTCSTCNHSYRDSEVPALGAKIPVTFSVPAGVTAPAIQSAYAGNTITLPSVTGTPAGDSHSSAFIGWIAATVDNATAIGTYYAAGDEYTVTEATTFYALYRYAVGGSVTTEYVLTDISAISATDEVVITMEYDGTVYALPNDSSSSPSAVIIGASEGKLTSAPDENLLWNVGGTEGEYTFSPIGDAESWLYCTSSNSGVRVGASSSNTFKIDASSGYLRHNGTNRYLGVYRSKPDWRCYTSTSINIGGQTLGFYVKSQGGIVYYTTVFPEPACQHSNTSTDTVQPTCTQTGSVVITCEDCGEVVKAETLAATGHSYSMTTVAPSCTERGYDFYYCPCGESYMTNEIPALGHSYTYTNNGDDHSITCANCDYAVTESHNYVDSSCICGAVETTEPTVDSNISIGETLSLESDLTMNLRIKTSQLTAYDLSTAYLVVERDVYNSNGTMEVETRTLTDYTIKDNRLVFAYTGISAAQMNDEIRAVLYIKDANGKEYKSNQKVTSVAIYSDLMLGASAGNEKLITLIMDMLNYGTAAQIYFNRHADAPVNEAFESFKTYASYASSDLKAALEDMSGTISNGNSSATVTQGLDLSTRVGITYKVKLPTGVSATNATLIVKDANGNALETFDLSSGTVDSKGRYCVTFFGSTSREMRRVVYATVTVDGAAISDTYTYSISTYAHTIATTAGMPASLVELTKLMVIYGDSAEAYFAG